jgi:hypothetical protein
MRNIIPLKGGRGTIFEPAGSRKQALADGDGHMHVLVKGPGKLPGKVFDLLQHSLFRHYMPLCRQVEHGQAKLSTALVPFSFMTNFWHRASSPAAAIAK